MKRLGALLVAAGLVASAAASPALADHDRDHHRHHDRWEHHGGHYRRYDHDWNRHYYGYYEEPRVEYYGPRVYVPPPPAPSFGLNLVFPIH